MIKKSVINEESKEDFWTEELGGVNGKTRQVHIPQLEEVKTKNERETMRKDKIYIKTVELDDYEFIKRFNELIKKLNLEEKIKVDEHRVQIILEAWNPEKTEEILLTLSDYVKHGKRNH